MQHGHKFPRKRTYKELEENLNKYFMRNRNERFGVGYVFWLVNLLFIFILIRMSKVC